MMSEQVADYPEFELFVRGGTEHFIEGERRLIEQGAEAVPKLRGLLAGTAVNRFGVPYRRIGQSITCALETVRRLGPIASELEDLVVRELKDRRHTAAMALREMGTLSESAIVALAEAMGSADLDLSMESAVTLAVCRAAGHPSSVAIRSELAGTKRGDYIEQAIARHQR